MALKSAMGSKLSPPLALTETDPETADVSSAVFIGPMRSPEELSYPLTKLNPWL